METLGNITTNCRAACHWSWRRGEDVQRARAAFSRSSVKGLMRMPMKGGSDFAFMPFALFGGGILLLPAAVPETILEIDAEILQRFGAQLVDHLVVGGIGQPTRFVLALGG